MHNPWTRLTDRLGDLAQLDAVAEPVASAVRRWIPAGSGLKDALSGTWLGHPLHPMLTDIPIGSFTSATVLDLVGGRRGIKAAQRLTELGLVSAIATAAAGASDWSDTHGAERRIGVVHAGANTIGVACYGASWVARHRGHRVRATALGLAGMSVMTVAGYLGGHLIYGRGVGVNNNAFQQTDVDWTPVLDEAALGDGESARVDAGPAPVLVHRCRGRLVAVGSVCPHAGGPLEQGTIDDDDCTVTCPWHGSVFKLDTGEVVHGPATVGVPHYDTRVAQGRIDVRSN